MRMSARNRPYPVGTTGRSTVGAAGPVLHARTGLPSSPSRPERAGRVALCGATVYPTEQGDAWVFDASHARACPGCALSVREAAPA